MGGGSTPSLKLDISISYPTLLWLKLTNKEVSSNILHLKKPGGKWLSRNKMRSQNVSAPENFFSIGAPHPKSQNRHNFFKIHGNGFIFGQVSYISIREHISESLVTSFYDDDVILTYKWP